MKAYLLNITGAVIITVISEILLPENWNKYIKIITGLIIISAIAYPIKDKLNFSISDSIPGFEEISQKGESYSNTLIKEELAKKINTDCEERLMREYNADVKVKSEISVNSDGDITGVKRISIKGKIPHSALERINEIYAPEEVIADEY